MPRASKPAGEETPPADTAPAKLAEGEHVVAAPMVEALASTAADPMEALGFTTLEASEEFTKALLFGMPGSGKTTAAAFAAMIPGPGLTVFINAESGLKKTALKRLGVDTSKIVIWPDATKGEELTYDGLEKLLFRLSHLLRNDPQSVKVVSFDSLTEVVNKLMEQITTRAYEKDQSLTDSQKRRREADNKRLRESKFETQLQDYGLMTTQIRTLMRSFRDLPTHFVATALLRSDLPGEDGIKQTGPEMTPKLSESVRGYFDLVLHFRAETLPVSSTEQETLITADTKTTLRLQAKDRLGVLPVELPNPTFDRIHAYAQGTLTPETDPEFERFDAIRAASQAYKDARKSARRGGTALATDSE